MSSETILFRQIAPDQIKRIQDLARKIWPPAFAAILTPEQIAYMMEMMYAVPVLQKELERGVEFFILTCDNEDAGYTAIEKKGENTYKLHKIYLSPHLQGKGLGKYQLLQTEQIVKNYGGHSLYLNVNRNNQAIHFYKSQGYEIVAEEDIDIGNGFFMNDYVMKKDLF